MIWIIDRIENNIAVCEVDTKTIDVPLSALPNGVCEGDVISLTIDKKQTDDRKENINKLMNSLFKD
jgi:hypothetical protein